MGRLGVVAAGAARRPRSPIGSRQWLQNPYSVGSSPTGGTSYDIVGSLFPQFSGYAEGCSLERWFTFSQVSRVQVRIDGEPGIDLQRGPSGRALAGVATRSVSVLGRWMAGIVERGE